MSPFHSLNRLRSHNTHIKLWRWISQDPSLLADDFRFEFPVISLSKKVRRTGDWWEIITWRRVNIIMKVMYDIVAHIQCILVYPCIPVLKYCYMHGYITDYTPIIRWNYFIILSLSASSQPSALSPSDMHIIHPPSGLHQGCFQLQASRCISRHAATPLWLQSRPLRAQPGVVHHPHHSHTQGGP